MLAFRDTETSDTNKDNKVSIKEALEYAKSRHSFTRRKSLKPFIQSSVDPDKVFLK